MIKIRKTEITKVGVNINISLSQDNLMDNALFLYSILDEKNESIQRGIIRLEKDEYKEWDGSNDKAYDIILKKLGIERE